MYSAKRSTRTWITICITKQVVAVAWLYVLHAQSLWFCTQKFRNHDRLQWFWNVESPLYLQLWLTDPNFVNRSTSLSPMSWAWRLWWWDIYVAHHGSWGPVYVDGTTKSWTHQNRLDVFYWYSRGAACIAWRYYMHTAITWRLIGRSSESVWGNSDYNLQGLQGLLVYWLCGRSPVTSHQWLAIPQMNRVWLGIPRSSRTPTI